MKVLDKLTKKLSYLLIVMIMAIQLFIPYNISFASSTTENSSSEDTLKDDTSSSEDSDSGEVIASEGLIKIYIPINTSQVNTDSGKNFTKEDYKNKKVKLKVWKIADIDEVSDFSSGDKLLKKTGEFNEIDYIDLNSKYESFTVTIKDVENYNGREHAVFEISGIADGVYYVRGAGEDVAEDERLNLIEDGKVVNFIFLLPNLSGEKSYNIYPKETEDVPVIPKKDIELVKVDKKDKTKLLSGAKFELHRIKLDENDKEVGKDEVYTNDGKFAETSNNIKIYETGKDGRPGKIRVSNLDEGYNYYFKEIEAPSGYKIIGEGTSQKIKLGNSTIVENEENPENPKGSKDFIKVSSKDKNLALEGAQFQVFMKSEDGKDIKVINPETSETYIVTSGKDGKFSVKGLAYGDYYLIELKAPEGYQRTGEKIDFTIAENSQEGTTTIQVITNRPDDNTPPPPTDDKKTPPTTTPPKTTTSTRKITVPKTGDILVIVMSIVGALMIIMGSKLIFEKDNKDKV